MIITVEGLPGCRKDEIFKALEQIGIHIHSTKSGIRAGLTGFSDEIQRFINLDEMITSDLVENYTGSAKRLIWVDGMYSMRHVYANCLKHDKLISEQEYNLIDKLHKRLFNEPNIIIYLFGTFDSNFNRASESGLKYTEEEFKQLHYQYEWVFDTNNCHIPIYKVSIEDDLESIIGNIKAISTYLAEDRVV